MESLAIAKKFVSSEADELQELVAYALECARRNGASASFADASRNHGYEMTVRFGDVEKVEHENEKQLGVDVYFGERTGSASTSDFEPQAIEDAVKAACSIARFTSDDPCNGLPPAERLASGDMDLELDWPWDIDRDGAFELARSCEDVARSEDDRIVNSDGATVKTSCSISAMANSSGLAVSGSASSHSIGCVVVARSNGRMQRDYWYSSVRDPRQMDAPEKVGRTAARRVVRRLDARRIKTCVAPVLFEAPVAGSLLMHLLAAINGGSVYRRASFLLDRVGTQVFPEWIRIHEQPHLKRAARSGAFDSEGVATQASDIVADGVLQRYVLDSYAARKLGRETTGNAGGVFNLTLDSGSRGLDELIRAMGRGLLVTEMIGFGVNTVTGDYSRGASGFWVENGEIQYPVEELTIAGNLADIFMSIAEVGCDGDDRRSIRTGSILVERMAIGGE